MRRVLAICDTEEEYVRKLMRYLNECGQIPFEVEAYTSLELFLEKAREEPPTVLLISVAMMQPILQELDIGKIILLSQGNPIGTFGEYPSVAKYQAASGIVREVMQYYMGTMQAVTAMVGVKTCKFIGIYSPVKCCGKTCLSLALSACLAKDRKVLYLNLEGQSGFRHLFNGEDTADITDAVYYFRQGKETGLERMKNMVRKMEGFSYFLPAMYEEDMKSVEGQEWEVFLKLLEEKAGYEILVVDVGDTVKGVGRILNLCDTILMPEKPDRISQAKLSEGVEALTTSGYGAVMERVTKTPAFPAEGLEKGELMKLMRDEKAFQWIRTYIPEL